ncbi:hypothetical protein ACFL0V_02020 [Nanoarchaeota archaeon]
MKKTVLIVLLVILCAIFASSVNAVWRNLRPDGDGVATQWYGQYDCDGYDCINEVLRNDSTYVFTNISNQTEYYTLENWTLSDDYCIENVNFYVVGKYYDSTHYYFSPGFIINGTWYEWGSVGLPSYWSSTQLITDENPATGEKWKASELDDLGIGVKTKTSVPGAIISQYYVRVNYRTCPRP